MSTPIYSLISVLIVSLLSLSGVLFVALNSKTLQKILLLLVSFAAGGLMGDTFIHLLPEAIAETGFTLKISLAIISGLLLFFILEKFIHWRHCHVPTSKSHPHPVVFMNLVGDGLHNFIDGAVIAASFIAGQSLGIATTLAVIFHEIPQEIGDFGVLIHGGFGRKKALLFNFASALTAVLGVLVVWGLNFQTEDFTRLLIPFTAGGFLYIAGSDLIPELHKETAPAKSLLQFLGLLLGIGLMLGLTILE